MNPLQTRHRIARSLNLWLLVLAAGLRIQTREIQAQSFSFDDGNDTGWTRYEPLKGFGIRANFTFPAGAYRIRMDPPPDTALFDPAKFHSRRIRFTDADGEQTVSWTFGAPAPAGPTLLSALLLEGPYMPDTTGTMDAAAGTISIPVPTATRFYHLSETGTPTISSVTQSAGFLRLTFR